ncbi:hypothetical protein [Scytonema sp. NUACC26]|uniref:hypothetical protein n=1 Tax=Scytonema sp. NUACC26 TaxID=3140176 RepID=UPI0034DBB905
MTEPLFEPLTPYLAIQKYLEVLESVQKALGIESVSEPKQVLEPELENELIELEPVEPALEIGSSRVIPQLFCGNNTWTAEQQTEQKSYLAQLKTENIKMRNENHQKFLQSQANFAQTQALFADNQARFRSRGQKKSR